MAGERLARARIGSLGIGGIESFMLWTGAVT
jgi:hypothetical protein